MDAVPLTKLKPAWTHVFIHTVKQISQNVKYNYTHKCFYRLCLRKHYSGTSIIRTASGRRSFIDVWIRYKIYMNIHAQHVVRPCFTMVRRIYRISGLQKKAAELSGLSLVNLTTRKLSIQIILNHLEIIRETSSAMSPDNRGTTVVLA